MPRYDYKCSECSGVFEISKSMKDPSPDKCLLCGVNGCLEQVIHSPNISYGDRPPWTYKEAKKYQTSRHNDGPRFKLDPNKVGDMACRDNPGELAPPTRSDLERAKKKQDVLKKGGYMSDANRAAGGSSV